jgi:Phytanoyl-CoA dioxygenase (PhyH)
MASFSLTPERRETFERDGMLRVPGFFAPSDMAAMADVLWTDLRKRFGIERHCRETWQDQRPAQFKSLTRSGAFDALRPGLAALADEFFGIGNGDGYFGGPLVTFPTGDWAVPHNVWHLDSTPSDYATELNMIRVFTFLEPVNPRGGGTCYVEGSNRVVMDRVRNATPRERLRSADIKAILEREEPWFRSLFSRGGDDRERRFMVEGGTARGIAVRVKEVTGEPGDVYIMHPAMLHTIAPNALDRPRMMLGFPLIRRIER